ncbi:hypothetical protein AEM38_00800 [Hyphomonadaceae bacterium UKL13-1]|nr:hypothetical protein AEM38_00800 [Hyphomonadaceae bacterium UKL13-1]
MKPVNHDPQTLTTTSFSTISAKHGQLVSGHLTLKADMGGKAEHFDFSSVEFLQNLLVGI